MTRRTIIAGGVVAVVAAAALQYLHSVTVGQRLCAVVGASTCPASRRLASVTVEVPLPAALAALDGRPIRAVAHTGLVRRTCDGGWTAGPGARIELAGPARDTPAGTASPLTGCLDTDGAAVDGGLDAVELTRDGCTLRLDRVRVTPARLESAEALEVSVTAAIAAASASRCAEVLALPVSGLHELLAQVQVQLTSRVARAGGEGPATAASGSGRIRRLLAAMPTSHDLAVTTPAGAATVRLTSTPAADSGPGSPVLHLAFTADGLLASRVPEAFRRLDVRWRLDHETGEVEYNGRRIQRAAAAPRPSGRVVVGDECAMTAGNRPRRLFFVEAGDDGELRQPAQLDAVLAAADGAAARAGALVLVFVHGWQHSAAPGDSYVCRVADLVASVEDMEASASRATGRPAREAIGVYVGWPGALYPDDTANTVTTFWNRLGVADHLGAARTSLRPLLTGIASRLSASRLDRRADRRSMFVVAGHSMGGRAVFRALRDGLLAPDAARAEPDLVLLLNPAFSASDYRALHDRQAACTSTGAPVLLFSSESDGVTRQLYPAGQAVSYADSLGPFLEHVHTAPNFREFVTHRLRLEVAEGGAPAPDGPHTLLRGFERVPANSRELYEDNPVTVYRLPPTGRPAASDVWYRLRLLPIKGRTPCPDPTGASKVVEVDARIVPDHNAIFTPPFMEYIVRVLNRQARGGDASRSP
jgi:hypothetical protein